MAGRTILVAEDEASVRTFLVIVLERSGYQVLAAVDGSEAIAILGNGAIVVDAVVSDVDMPGATESRPSFDGEGPDLVVGRF